MSNCSFSGEIHLSPKAWEDLLCTELDFDYYVETFLNDFSEFHYENGVLSIRFNGDGYYIRSFLKAVATLKDINTVDKLRYTSDGPNDCGWIYIKPGKWARVSDACPDLPPDNSSLWQHVAWR